MAFVVAVQGYTLPTLPVPVAKRVGAGAARDPGILCKAPVFQHKLVVLFQYSSLVRMESPFAMHMRGRVGHDCDGHGTQA